MGKIFRGIFGTVSTLGHQAGAFSLLEERERMRTNWVLTTAVMAMSVTAAVGAQSAKAMHRPSKGDAMSVAYTGCVESVNHGGAFLLTKIDRVDSIHDDKTMKHHDDMAMKSDAARTMQHEQPP